jgi:hypothetical protein
MAYSAGSIITAVDYNGFVSTNGQNVNNVWSTGSGTSGYGETAVSTVASGAIISATQWSTLNSKISAIASHTGSVITNRANPTAGQTISVLANVQTDISTITANRGNAVASGAQYTTIAGTNSKTGTTGTGISAWSLTFTNTITFANANAARYFFNAGGRLKLETSKTATGTLADPEWNDLATNLMADLFITGRAQTIAGTAYLGTTRSGGTGVPQTYQNAIGFSSLTATDQLVYRQYADTAPYTGMNIAVYLKSASGGAQVVVTTVWTDPGAGAAYGEGIISGGTAASGATPGTAPCTIVTYFAPSSTYLTSAAWGVPTITASVA